MKASKHANRIFVPYTYMSFSISMFNISVWTINASTNTIFEFLFRIHVHMLAGFKTPALQQVQAKQFKFINELSDMKMGNQQCIRAHNKK